MRKIAFLAAAAAAVCTVACNKDLSGNAGIENTSEPVKVETGELKISIVGNDGQATKAVYSTDDANFSKVHNLQLFVFDGDVLDVYSKVENTKSATLTCRKGTKKVFALVNAPELSNIKSLSQLKGVITKLSDNTSQFVMVGSKDDVVVPSADPIEVAVKRVVARVALKKITVAFTNSAYPGSGAKIKKIFLSNVPTNTNLDLSMAPTAWVNKMAFSASDAPQSLISDTNEYDLGNSVYPNYFYSYPNPTVADAKGGSWSARHTRLVVETLIDGGTYYYPITLPVLESGKSYEIENLTLTRLGSTTPDQPVELSDATFEIKVTDWTVVPVTDGITI